FLPSPRQNRRRFVRLKQECHVIEISAAAQAPSARTRRSSAPRTPLMETKGADGRSVNAARIVIGGAQTERKKSDDRSAHSLKKFRGCHCGARCRNGAPLFARICSYRCAAVRQRRTAAGEVSAKASDDWPDQQTATTGNAFF